MDGGWMHGWMSIERMDGWIDGWMSGNGWTEGWMDGMGGQMEDGEWMHECMSTWMDEIQPQLYHGRASS